MESFGNRLSPKGKTLGTYLFLITSPIEWYKLHSHSANCTEVTALCLQRYVTGFAKTKHNSAIQIVQYKALK